MTPPDLSRAPFRQNFLDAEPAGTEGIEQGPGPATSIQAKVYKLAVAASADCTAPTTVFESTNGVQADLVGKQTFGSGKIANGTYRCVIIEMSKLASVTSATCSAPASYPLCSDGQQSKLTSGSNVTCSGGAGNDQRIALYFTTLAATNTGNNVFLPPTSASDTANGIDTPTYGFGVP